MRKWIEATGKTDEAAIAAALDQLGLDRDEVSVEILERARPGFLGLRKTLARVKVSYEAPDEEPELAPAEKVKEPSPQTVPEKDGEQKEAAPAESARAADGDFGRSEAIAAFLNGLMEHMGANARPIISGSPEEGYKVVLEGEGLGALIGRRGETLDAIQQLTSYAVNRGQTKRVRVHVDAESYRARREESLQRLARKVAEKVVKNRRNVALEPMNAYERHVIHAALQDYPDVVTYSTGNEPNRRTVVAYSKGEHRY